MEREWTGNPRRLSEADRVEIERLVHLGEKYEEIGAAVRCSAKSIQRYMSPCRPAIR
jgi:DNA-directed RNA polymerase specialized sigma24 family protein